MFRNTCLLFVATVLVVCTSTVIAAENSSNRMTGGTFGIAWLGPSGEIFRYDGTNPPARLLPEMTATRLIAADVDADGQDELALLDTAVEGLYIFDFEDEKLVGGHGSNVATITAGRFERDKESDAILACTHDRYAYIWTAEIGAGPWTPVPGDFDSVARGDFDTRSELDEAVVTARGDVYLYNPKWKTYSQLMMGRNARAVVAGNLTAYPGDEAVVSTGDDGALYLCQGRKSESIEQKAAQLAVGRMEEGPDRLFVVSAGGVAMVYDRSNKTFQPLGTATGLADLILYDLDGDGNDELYATVKDDPEKLLRLSKTDGEFQPVGQ